jgi:hypothetical protein
MLYRFKAVFQSCNPLFTTIHQNQIELLRYRLIAGKGTPVLVIFLRLLLTDSMALYGLEIQKKIDAIELAEKLENVSEAARIIDCSRETNYKNRRLLKEKGPYALKRAFRRGIYPKNRTAKEVKNLIITFSLENPQLGQVQVSAQLTTGYQLEIGSAGVKNV